MGKGRLEAFSDGVIAIIIIMVLELKVPHGASLDTLAPLLPVLLSYMLSFIYVGIYCYKLQQACYPSGRRGAVLGTLGLAALVSGCATNLDKVDEETQIQQTVLRYLFEHNAAAGKNHIFCVAIGKGETASDAPAKLIQSLSDATHKVMKSSDCNKSGEYGVTEHASGKRALMLKVSRVSWLTKDEAVVEGGYFQGSLSSSRNTYRLKKINGHWRVVSDVLDRIS